MEAWERGLKITQPHKKGKEGLVEGVSSEDCPEEFAVSRQGIPFRVLFGAGY